MTGEIVDLFHFFLKEILLDVVMSNLPHLLVATRNAHKTEEISAMLEEFYAVSDLNGKNFPEVEETGTTFLANATLKAEQISAVTGGLVLSDDSGLEVDALGGEPGVYSSRYAGLDGDNAANNAKLMEELSKLPKGSDRVARFRCVMVLAENGVSLAHFDGAVEGRILEEMRGTEGFGYDPLFQPDGYEETFAELGVEVKNTLSHRANALKKAVEWMSTQR